MKFPREQARLAAILADKGYQIWWGHHASDQMKARCITQSDVKRVLTGGHVTMFEKKQDDIVHVEGRDLDGRLIRVVVGLRDASRGLRMITAIVLRDTG